MSKHRGQSRRLLQRIGAWKTRNGWFAEAVLPVSTDNPLPFRAVTHFPCRTRDEAIKEVRQQIATFLTQTQEGY